MDAAEELVLSQGTDHVSMTDVASHAGLTRTALYNYFPDRSALFLALAERINTAFVERYRRALPSGLSCARRLSAFVRLQLEGLVTHPPSPRACLGPEAQTLAVHVAPMRHLLTEILEEGVAAGEFDPLPARATAELALSMVEAQRVPLTRGEADLNATHSLLTRFALRGLGVPTETVDTVLPHPPVEAIDDDPTVTNDHPKVIRAGPERRSPR